jgi:flagellar protein FliS
MTQSSTYSQAASSYRSVAATVAPLAAVVMLYDVAVLELRRAVGAIEQKRLDQAFDHLQRANTILRGLCHSLDFSSGGAFPQRMHDTYVRLILSALHAFGKPDAIAQLHKLISAISGLRDAWADARLQQARSTPVRS